MNIKNMKLIDETLAPLACFFLYWYNLMRKLFVRPQLVIDPDKVKNILLIKFFGMGSIILATPMMKALKTKFPNAKLTILTFSGNREICERIKLIDGIVTLDPATPLTIIKSLADGVIKIRERHCEISVDLEYFAKSSTIIQYLCGSKIRIGYYIIQFGHILKMLWRGDLLTYNVYYNPHRHAVDTFLALARIIGADTDDTKPASLEICDGDEARLQEAISDLKINRDSVFITVNINASQLCLERRWPIEKFAELIKKILDCSNAMVLLIGDRQDVGHVNKMFKLTGNNARLFNMAGKLDIGMLNLLLRYSKLFITNDSGPLHLAASLDIPTVSLFGPEIPDRFRPVGDKHIVFYSGVYCSPCLNVYNQKSATCVGENECMRKISVETVFSAIWERHLKNTKV